MRNTEDWKKKTCIFIENHTIDDENIRRALVVLHDNGIDEDECEVVLQAIGYTLLDEELFPEV